MRRILFLYFLCCFSAVAEIVKTDPFSTSYTVLDIKSVEDSLGFQIAIPTNVDTIYLNQQNTELMRWSVNDYAHIELDNISTLDEAQTMELTLGSGERMRVSYVNVEGEFIYEIDRHSYPPKMMTMHTLLLQGQPHYSRRQSAVTILPYINLSSGILKKRTYISLKPRNEDAVTVLINRGSTLKSDAKDAKGFINDIISQAPIMCIDADSFARVINRYYKDSKISDAGGAIKRINELMQNNQYKGKATIELENGELIDIEYGELTGYFVDIDPMVIVPLAVSVAVPNYAGFNWHNYVKKEKIAYKSFNIELCGKENVYDYEW